MANKNTAEKNITSVLLEERTFPPSRAFAAHASIKPEDAAALPALLKLLVEEESVRVRNKIVEGLVAQGWEIPSDQRDAASRAMPGGYTVDAKGHAVKR